MFTTFDEKIGSLICKPLNIVFLNSIHIIVWIKIKGFIHPTNTWLTDLVEPSHGRLSSHRWSWVSGTIYARLGHSHLVSEFHTTPLLHQVSNLSHIINVWAVERWTAEWGVHCRDALATSSINCVTSFFAGFVIFSVLGYMSKKSHTPIDKVATEGERTTRTWSRLYVEF